MEQKILTGYPSIDKPWLKYYSEEAINTPLPECTIYEYLWENNKDHLDDVALNYFDRHITFRDLFISIDEAARAFTALGVKQGDIVVFATVTTPETIYAVYALNRLGAVANMVDPRTSVEGVHHYITEVQATHVLSLDVAYPKIEKAITGTRVKTVIIVSPADSLSVVKKMLFLTANRIKGKAIKPSKNIIKWKYFIENGAQAVYTPVSYKKNTCCVIVHTGGTTGVPKGVMLSDDNLNIMAMQYRLLGVEFNRTQNFLNIMPPFIAYGIVLGIQMPLCLGLTNVLIPQLAPDKFADLIIKHKPAHMLGVPTHFEKLRSSQKMNGFDLRFFESAGAGGDAITERFEKDINQFLKEHNSKYEIAKGYGMTEISSAATACRGKINRFRSVGVPHLFTVVSVFDPETKKELPYGECGEICMRGPTVMLGYYNAPGETNDILQVHEDGYEWLHSNDIGFMDTDGFLYVEGRIKRMIIRYDGFKVFPSLIENTIASHKSVEACCVVGTADTAHNQGALPLAHIVLKEKFLTQSKEVENELIALCEKNLPEYAQPIGYRFRDNLPLTPIGKVDYRALEREFEEFE